jgi:hypothetical protein
MGKYPSNIAQDVPPEYLNQYFLDTPEGYEATKSPGVGYRLASQL